MSLPLNVLKIWTISNVMVACDILLLLKEKILFMKRIDLFLALLVIFGGLMIIAGAVVMLKSVDFAPEALPFL